MTTSTPPPSLSLMDDKGCVVKTWTLAGKRSFRLGRGSGNDIELGGNWVSRQHAMLQVEENGLIYAVDLGSANGTMVNGHRIYAPTPLRSGDLVQIGGRSVFTFLQDYTVAVNNGGEDEQTVALMTKTKVTVLICDIRHFTSLSEKLGDQQVSDLVQLWSRKANAVVANHHGRIDKFIGDAAMAIWSGGPGLRHTVQLALACAVRMAAMTADLGRTIPGLPWPLTIGAALNTGEAVVGNIGVDGNRDYTVIGDTVNVAFRLEELTSELGKDILLGGDAAALLDPELLQRCFVACRYRVKGKEAPVTAYGATFDQLRTYLERNTPGGA